MSENTSAHDLDTERPAAEERLMARRIEEQRAVEEAGGGVSEGFELAEEQLVEHASHGDEHGTTMIIQDSRDEAEDADETHGEADAEADQDLGR